MSNKSICPDLTVSLVNTNNRELLEACLESLFAQAGCGLDTEIYVVDNVSTDGSAQMVAERFPSVKLICNSKREGFGANHNKVLRIGTGRYFLVLNEDTVILEGALDRLVRFADEHPEAGVVGPRVLNPDGSLQDSCGHFPTFFREIRHTLVQRFTDYCLDAYPRH